MKMLYMNDSTHEESIVDVQAYTEAEIRDLGYMPGVKLFRQLGEMEKTLASSRDIDLRLDSNVHLRGRNGVGVILSEEQVAILRAKTAQIRVEKHPAPTAIQTGEACHSCGFPRRRGECKRCGDE